jgi:hypothetical protein
LKSWKSRQREDEDPVGDFGNIQIDFGPMQARVGLAWYIFYEIKKCILTINIHYLATFYTAPISICRKDHIQLSLLLLLLGAQENYTSFRLAENINETAPME